MELRLRFSNAWVFLSLLFSKPSWLLAAVLGVAPSTLTTAWVGLVTSQPMSPYVFLQAMQHGNPLFWSPNCPDWRKEPFLALPVGLLP